MTLTSTHFSIFNFQKHCKKPHNTEPSDPSGCIDLVGCEAECEEQDHDKEASVTGSISKDVDQMLLDDSDVEVDVMEATSGVETDLLTSATSGKEEDFEILVSKQTGAAAVPQKLIVSRLSAGQRERIKDEHFHKKVWS